MKFNPKMDDMICRAITLLISIIIIFGCIVGAIYYFMGAPININRKKGKKALFFSAKIILTI